jgi:uncharacterized membrane protein YfcA
MTGIPHFAIASASSPTGDELSALTLVGLGVMSLAIGLIGGLVGIALGIIRLPAMTMFGVDPLVAAGANLFISALSSIAGSWPAILENRVAFRVVILLGVPAFIGSLIGGLFADVAPIWLLLSAVSVFLVWSAISLIVQAYNELKIDKAKRRQVATYDGTLSSKTIVREGSLGAAIGLVGGAVGLALGVLRMPALVQVLKMDPATAAGTNLIITVLVGISGFVGHLIGGRNDWTLIAVVGGTAAVGMFIGSKMTHRVEPAKLRLFVGVVLLFVAPLVLWDAVTR